MVQVVDQVAIGDSRPGVLPPHQLMLVDILSAILLPRVLCGRDNQLVLAVPHAVMYTSARNGEAGRAGFEPAAGTKSLTVNSRLPATTRLPANEKPEEPRALRPVAFGWCLPG